MTLFSFLTMINISHTFADCHRYFPSLCWESRRPSLLHDGLGFLGAKRERISLSRNVCVPNNPGCHKPMEACISRGNRVLIAGAFGPWIVLLRVAEVLDWFLVWPRLFRCVNNPFDLL